MLSSRRVIVSGLVLAVAASGGCESGQPKRGAAKGARMRTEGPGVAGTPVEPDGGRYRDPVARATLREKALTVLSAAAATGDGEERANAIEALQTSPARLYPVLERGLNDASLGVRAVSAMAVGRARLDAALDKVRPLLGDSAPQVRAAAMFAIKRCGEPVDLTPLAGMLQSDDLRVRAQAAFLLGELGEPSAIGLLRDAARESVVKKPPAQVRIMDLQLAEARVKLGDEGAIQDIRAALFPARPEDLEAAALACQIIGQVRDQASVNRLIVLTAVQDDSKQFMPAEIRLAAAGALARLGQRQGSYIADQYRADGKEALRAQSAFVYGETGRIENLPTLSQMMSDSNGRVRVAAAAAIVKITEGAGAGGA